MSETRPWHGAADPFEALFRHFKDEMKVLRDDFEIRLTTPTPIEPPPAPPVPPPPPFLEPPHDTAGAKEPPADVGSAPGPQAGTPPTHEG